MATESFVHSKERERGESLRETDRQTLRTKNGSVDDFILDLYYIIIGKFWDHHDYHHFMCLYVHSTRADTLEYTCTLVLSSGERINNFIDNISRNFTPLARYLIMISSLGYVEWGGFPSRGNVHSSPSDGTHSSQYPSTHGKWGRDRYHEGDAPVGSEKETHSWTGKIRI